MVDILHTKIFFPITLITDQENETILVLNSELMWKKSVCVLEKFLGLMILFNSYD